MNDLKSVLRSATVMFLFVGLVGIWVGGCEGRETQEQTVERLIKRLGHKKANGRANAAGALGRIGKDAVPALIQALKDQDVGVRWNAAGALKKIGTPEAIKATIPTLIQALQDQDADVRQDIDVRQEVVWALGWIGSGAKDASIEGSGFKCS